MEYQLEKNTFEFDEQVQNLDLLGSAGYDLVSYEGWDHLNIKSVTVLPWDGPNEMDFVARQTVHVESEFHVLPNNEVHLYTAETFPDCDDNSFMEMLIVQDGASGVGNPKANNAKQKIELRFIEPDGHSRVFPNPFTSELQIVFGTEVGSKQVELCDGLGRTIERWNSSTAKLYLSIGEIEPGPYLLRITNERIREVFTVIKQL